MDRIREIISRGYWIACVYDSPPRVGARTTLLEGEFATEADAIAKAEAVIADGRAGPSILFHSPTAKPSVRFHLNPNDMIALGRAIAAGRDFRS